jgi:glycosyltransferase involved in cell wall biosynthesis
MIAISALFLRPGRVGGVEHMFKNLLEGIASQVRSDLPVLVVNDVVGEDLRPFGYPMVSVGPAGNRFVHETLKVPRMGLGATAILYPNYFTPPTRAASRVITVVHDLQYRRFPSYFSARKRLFLNTAIRSTMSRAEVVVAISEAARLELLDAFPNRRERDVVAIHNPVSWDRFGGDGVTHGPPTPYLLAVAAHYPHKNIDVLLRAFALARDKLAGHRLVLVGQTAAAMGTGRLVDLPSVIRECNLGESVVTTGYISDIQLGRLYRGASAFVLPSSYEGFGMPAVEALGFRVPVITSRDAALVEVTRGLACYVDRPTNVSDLAETIVAVVSDPAGHQPSVRAAAALRDAYSPTTAARRYLKVLSS